MSTNFSTLTKSGSGSARRWEEADSLLPETPIRHPLELTSYPVGDERRARYALYGSHFLSTWGQRAWEFAVGLVMLEIRPNSLLLVSLFGLCDAATLVVLGPAVGALIDRLPRIEAATKMYILQNAAVATCAATCLALLWGVQGGSLSSVAYWALVVCAIISGAISSLGAMGASLSVEREWTKTLCGGDSEALAQINAVMKRIDLTCLIVSPIAVGLLMTWRIDIAVGAIALWNIAAWAPECSLLRRAQQVSPILAAPKAVPRKDEGSGSGALSLISRLRRSFSGFRAYVEQPAVLEACSLALLYLTVMSFGTLMTAYLKWKGLGEAKLSVYRGLGALSGIAATLAFPPLQRRLGLVLTATGAVWFQLACLVLGALPELLNYFSIATPSTSLVTSALVAGLVMSRFGLWAFDLSVNQLIQETADLDSLGAVMGVQGSLQSVCQMLAYVAGVVVWRPESFPLLIAGSVVVVACAAGLSTLHAVRVSLLRSTAVAAGAVVFDEHASMSP